jgi:SAM-dependent methyltransferase
MSQNQYFAANERAEEELKRLRMQEEFNDPRSINRFEMIGVSEGWNCLEVGAGSGSMAQWLAKRVGANGKVVATDINIIFLKTLNVPNLEVRQHDILNDELEKDKYDLAHCRSLIMHLKEPEKALKRMAEAVRPGGWLCVEQTDYGSVSADLTNPAAALFNTVVPTIYGTASKMGIVDWYLGRRIPDLIGKLGFIELVHEGRNQVIRGSESQAIAQITTMQIQIKKLIAAGVITEKQNSDIQRLYHDPSFFYMGPTYFGVWGRKPMNKG